MTETTVWHVSPESNTGQIKENGLQKRSCAVTFRNTGDPTNPKRVTEGIYVCGTRRAMEKYAQYCLEDTVSDMDDGEQFALFRATVDRSLLTEDPESATDPGSPKAYIYDGKIEDVELVTVGVGRINDEG